VENNQNIQQEEEDWQTRCPLHKILGCHEKEQSKLICTDEKGNPICIVDWKKQIIEQDKMCETYACRKETSIRFSKVPTCRCFQK
jgi:hypothetical protein